jgi:hypothetical protein
MPNQLTEQIIKQKQKELEINDLKFIEEYIKDGNGTQAYMRVYPNCSYDSARALATRKLAKINMSELMEAMGLTKKSLLQMITVGMMKPTKKEGDEQVPDYAVRHKYLETALKVGKMIGNEGHTTLNVDEMVFMWGGDNNSNDTPEVNVVVTENNTPPLKDPTEAQ